MSNVHTHVHVDPQPHTQPLPPRAVPVAAVAPAVVAVAPDDSLRSVRFQPPRKRWPGFMAALVLGAGVAAAVVSSYYDDRTLGQRIDASVDTAGRAVQQQVQDIKSGATAVAEQGARSTGQLVESLADAGITAAVKTALAADPALSALRIEVSTHDGVVTLAGPAPDEKARERAAVLAAAPEGVRSVDNRLVVPPPPSRG